jgi:hypothetical protein
MTGTVSQSCAELIVESLSETHGYRLIKIATPNGQVSYTLIKAGEFFPIIENATLQQIESLLPKPQRPHVIGQGVGLPGRRRSRPRRWHFND